MKFIAVLGMFGSPVRSAPGASTTHAAMLVLD